MKVGWMGGLAAARRRPQRSLELGQVFPYRRRLVQRLPADWYASQALSCSALLAPLCAGLCSAWRPRHGLPSVTTNGSMRIGFSFLAAESAVLHYQRFVSHGRNSGANARSTTSPPEVAPW
eukprot:5839683-Prymnesium_polylepis.1